MKQIKALASANMGLSSKRHSSASTRKFTETSNSSQFRTVYKSQAMSISNNRNFKTNSTGVSRTHLYRAEQSVNSSVLNSSHNFNMRIK